MRKARLALGIALFLFLVFCFWSLNQRHLVCVDSMRRISHNNSLFSTTHPESMSTNLKHVETSGAPTVSQGLNLVGQRRRIAILSYNNGRAGHKLLADPVLAEMVRCNHAVYARTHGYDYISPERNSTTWSASRFILNGLRYKTFSVLSNFDKYDVLVWIDHDAVFFNQDLSVDHWLDKVMSANSDILVAEDLPGYKFNAGLQVIKTTAWTRMFYESAIDEILKTSTDATYLEQPIFYRLHDELEGAKQKIQIHTPRNDFQAFLKVKTDFKSTSWVVHGTFCDNCDLGKYVRQDECQLQNVKGEKPQETDTDSRGDDTYSVKKRQATQGASQTLDRDVGHTRPHAAVCLSGAVRTLTSRLSFSTIDAALNMQEGVEVDIFCLLTYNEKRAEVNSKGVIYQTDDEESIKLTVDSLAKHNTFGNCIYEKRDLELEKAVQCDFGAAGNRLIDRTRDTVSIRQGVPMLKRKMCYQMIVDAEKTRSKQAGTDWTYDSVISLRPDIFFFQPLTAAHLLPKVPTFPAPAHTSHLGPDVRGFPNDHVAFLPRAHAERYFSLANVYTNCTTTSSESPFILDLITKYFSGVLIDLEAVVPYSLNRPGLNVQHCERVAYFELNIGEQESRYWMKECEQFISWFFDVDKEGRNSSAVYDFWKRNSGQKGSA